MGRTLKDAGQEQAAQDSTQEAFACRSYGAVLQLVLRTVRVE